MNKKEKTGGRTKGTPNRTTAETKVILQKIVSKELDKLGALLEQLEPNDRINAIAKLLPYFLPKQNEIKTDLTTKGESLNPNPTDINIRIIHPTDEDE